MAIQVPEYLQTKTYSAKKDRRVQQAEVMQEGIVDFGHYKVTQRGAGANMSVDVAAGEAWVDGDSSAEQGFYHVVNDATVNVAIAAASGSNPRIDAVVLAVNDSTEIGGSDEYKLEALTGTATAGASLSNLTGKPAIGATKLLLAYILVPTSATKIENAQIGGLCDYRAGLTGYPAETTPKALEGAPAQYAHGRPLSYTPSALLKTSAGQAYGSPIAFNEEIYDNDEMHSNVSNNDRLVCKTPGVYLVTGQLQADASRTAGWAEVQLQLNSAAGVGIFTIADDIRGGSAQVPRFAPAAIVRIRYGEFVRLVYANNAAAGAPQNELKLGMTWQGP